MALKKQPVRLRDVALKAQVSEGTASKVLAGKGNISEETRLAIFTAADTLGYRPLKKAKTIGLLVESTVHAHQLSSYFSDILCAVEKACNGQDIGLMYAGIDPIKEIRLEHMPIMVKQGLVQGVIFTNLFNDELFSLFNELNIPTVYVDHYQRIPSADSVVYDDEEGGYQATRYLIEQGHTMPVPAMLSAPSRKTSLHRRYLGYRRALEEFGLAYDPAYVWIGEDGFVRAHEGIDAFFRLPIPPTAIFCCSDYTALEAIEVLRARQIQVPAQCSIIGFDDIMQSARSLVPLTTIHVDHDVLGVEAIHLLLTRMENPSLPSRQVRLGVTLVERLSVCPPTKKQS